MSEEKKAAPKAAKAEGKKVYCGPTIRGVANQIGRASCRERV